MQPQSSTGTKVRWIALLATLGHFFTWAVGSVTALISLNHLAAWWHAARILASLITPAQALALTAWSLITGALIAAGTHKRRVPTAWPVLAFCAGALVPLGLTLLSSALPTQAPAMTLLLVLYSLLMPWTLGRLITRLPQRANGHRSR